MSVVEPPGAGRRDANAHDARPRDGVKRGAVARHGAGLADALEHALWTPRAWIDGRWQEHVLLRIDAAGCWSEITTGVRDAPADARVLEGALLPGLVDAHSHAFQRAFAGLAERHVVRPDRAADDFWSWRDRMYRVALRITPEQLRAIAAQLYVELMCGGYTQVCEFHYLQHDEQGRPYADPATLALALADAAAETGIGLTVLPVLYERAGFNEPALRHDQRRFRCDAAGVDALRRAVDAAQRPNVSAGVAIHSLRAARPESIRDLLARVRDADVPIHIHVAEQVREVEESIATYGARPIEWLCRNFPLDPRWQLVHATHAVPSEIDAVGSSGAGIVICPTTEANLGDGLCDLPEWLGAGVRIAIGSDSQVCRQWPEELRWLEYGQRLVRRQRNVVGAAAAADRPSKAAHTSSSRFKGAGSASAPSTRAASTSAGADQALKANTTAQQEREDIVDRGRKDRSIATAARLFDAALPAGARSGGFPRWGFQEGARADALELDPTAPGLLGLPTGHALDALVFATDVPAFRTVHVAGRCQVEARRHRNETRIAQDFLEAMDALHDAST